MYQLSFYVPETHLEYVKKAIFDKGAGQIGHYANCAWQTLGQGQFQPLMGANPVVGEVNQVEQVLEYKVEMVCNKAVLASAIQAMKQAHPYETPAYHVIQLEDC